VPKFSAFIISYFSDGGSDLADKKTPKAAWHMVCLPKKEGGLGVIDLYVQNGALLLKNLHKFFNKANLPWVHLIWNNYYSDIKLQGYTNRGSSCWRDNIQLLTQFKGFASPLPKSGSTIHFWEDLWGGCVPKWAYPELLSFVKTKNLSLQKAADTYNLGDLFHLPLTAEAFTQLESLLDGIDSCNLGTEDDIWVYIWGANDYSLRQAYRFMKGHREIHPSFKWLWKSCCQLKHKFFFWLLLKDRLNVRKMLRWRTMDLDDYSCALCLCPDDETVEHLFLTCPFAQVCWNTVGLHIDTNLNPFAALESLR
jgi:hypothetical protein